MSLKKRGIALLQHKSIHKVAGDISVSYSVVRNWKRISHKIDKFKGNLRGAGRPPVRPEPEALLQFMDARRHQERALTCTHMVNFLKQHQNTWLQDCIRRQKEGSGYDILLKILQRFCGRHGYTHQQACAT
ncbi:hypothetical protein B5M09_013396 [Aphanomyces astaci]|nr:hypothetical protein B5M09_013396 [Aphanomyces astaci]